MTYSKDIVKGLTWTSAFRIITRFFAFIRIAFLARLLTPEQFGIFGISSLILAFFETISQTGTFIFLVQQKQKIDKYIDASYVISIARGFILAVIIFFSAPIITRFFNSPDSESLIKLIAGVALIRGFINPARISFLKYLKFEKEFKISLAVFMVDTIITIITAFRLHSAISLVWGLVAGAVTETILSHLLILPKPKFNFEINKIKKILKQGKWVTAFTVFNYFFEQGDDAFVGKLLNISALGIYQAAYKISTLPLTEISRVFNQVTFPVYSRIGNNSEVKSAFIKINISILLITTIIGIVIYVFPKEITLIILGKNWLEVVPILKLLSVFGVLRALMVATYPFFNALKLQNYIAKITLLSLITMILTIIPLINRFGTVGACYSVIIATIVTLPLIYYYLKKAFKKIYA
jgi:lipopolysaccharide exporter